MNKKLAKVFSTLVITITLLGFASIFQVSVVKADSAGLVFVDPANNVFHIPPTSLYSTFTLNVSIANMTGIAGPQFTLTWDPSMLECVSMNDVFFHDPLITKPADIATNLADYSGGIDNVLGTAQYAWTWKDGPKAKANGYDPANITLTGSAYGNPTYSWPEGKHALATFVFNITRIPAPAEGNLYCALHLTDVVVGDSNGLPLPVTPVDGHYQLSLPLPAPALVHVDPTKISNVSLTPGSDFTVNVNITNAARVYGLELSLSFNTSIIKADSVVPGDFIPLSSTIITQIDNATGFIMLNASSSSSLDGNGTLAQISFHVEGLGGTALHLYAVQLVDSLGQSLPYSTMDGSFDNVLLAKLAVDPPLIIDPTLLPPATFQINITIADVRGLYGYQFNLTFDPVILTCLQIQIHDVLNETHYIPNQNIDNTRGFVFTNVTYYSPAIPLDVDSPTPLVTIKFRVRAIGATNLTLTDTQLIDQDGQPITHEVQNGYFQGVIVDIAVISVSASPTAVYKGLSTNITVIAANHGNLTEDFTVNIYYNSTLLTSVNVTNLAPDANATITVTWNTATVSWGKYLMSAQVPPLPYETHTSDNTLVDGIFKVKIPGDLNGDDSVDILDSILLANAYGSNPTSPNWNPDADLNGDHSVNILDAILLANNFGTKI